MNRHQAVQGLKQVGKGVLTVGRYLHGDSAGEQQARRYDSTSQTFGRRGLVRRGPGACDAEPRDPLELTILGGDRDEYIDKSFWHDAAAAGVTFDESRVDGVWDEKGNEMWK